MKFSEIKRVMEIQPLEGEDNMKRERDFLVDAQVSSGIDPYPAWMRNLIYLSIATFGIAFWSALVLLIVK